MNHALQVICLCAQWCGVCRNYAAHFRQVELDLSSQAEFIWVDVEDQAELLGPLDIEDFPTLLIAQAGVVRFFGTVTPQAGVLARLVQNAWAGELGPLTRDPEINALAQRVTARQLHSS
jgi:thioredoxin 1